tara:strand:+ start:2132 stop:2959 length:828 start_codon:yes stop_codon:yes gene_type:complete
MANFILKNPIRFTDGTGFDTTPDSEDIFANSNQTITFAISQIVGSGSNVVFNQINSNKLNIDNGTLVLSGSTISGSFTQTGNQTISNNLNVSGNLSVLGTLTFEKIESELTQSYTIFKSGSTIFGDDINDIHFMTGSFLLSGSKKINGYSVNEISNDTSLSDSSATSLVTENSVISASQSSDDEIEYLRKSFTKVGTITNSSTASFSAVTASSPGILTNTSEVDFMFFNNGMLMEYDAIQIQQAGSNLLLKVNNNSIGYDLESGDEIVAFGKFNS